MPHEDVTPLAITQGEPFALTATVTDGALIYPENAIARGQIRKAAGNRLYLSLSERITIGYDGDDLILSMQLTGADTRKVQPGVYDVFVQDFGDPDETRAIRILHGPVEVEYAVTWTDEV